MTTRTGAAITALAVALLLAGCTGGSESKAASEEPQTQATAARPQVNARQEIAQISTAIPVYSGAEYRDDLTRRDETMIRNRYGADAKVYTLATDDSFPQVYHFYTTYLAQFRAFPARDTYPPERQDWRTLEVQLNEAMQDPFIPGQELKSPRHVTLQLAETEADPRTVIRYIVHSAPAPPPAAAPVPAAPAVASTPAETAQPLAR